MDDLFLKIISGDIPSSKVYEDEHTFAFLDINPVNHGHTLVVPKEHYRNVVDISVEAWARVMKTVRVLAPAIQKAVGADGINIVMSNGAAAGQDVFHAHVHIIPRFANDNAHNGFVHRTYETDEAKEVVAEKIRNAL